MKLDDSQAGLEELCGAYLRRGIDEEEARDEDFLVLCDKYLRSARIGAAAGVSLDVGWVIHELDKGHYDQRTRGGELGQGPVGCLVLCAVALADARMTAHVDTASVACSCSLILGPAHDLDALPEN